MNCVELAAGLEGTLLRQRDPHWLAEAQQHAEQCASCARLLELHHVEERLMELTAVEPSSLFLQTVMDRVTLHEPVAIRLSQRLSYAIFKYFTVFVGALLLAGAYVVPSAGKSWLSGLWPSLGLVRSVSISAFLTQHPPWAVLVAGVAALLILLGLAIPEREALAQNGCVREF